MYGPHREINTFCDSLKTLGIIRDDTIFLGGDLNLIIKGEWNLGRRSQETRPFGRLLFIDVWVFRDLWCGTNNDNWRNLRSEKEGLFEKLDIFMVSENIMEEVEILNSWLGEAQASNDVLIMLQMGKGDREHFGPFKFNHTCLEEEKSRELVIQN